MPEVRLTSSRSVLITAALLFVCLHALSIAVGSRHAFAASYPFVILAPALACFGTIRRARASFDHPRTGWTLFSIALFLWTMGTVLNAWEDMSSSTGGISIARISDFIYFLYGVPILLIISLPLSSERLRLFFWLDTIQAVLMAVIVYLELFPVHLYAQQPLSPIPATLLVTVYNMQNLLLAIAATVRLLTLSDRGEVRRRYRILVQFLWVYAVCLAAYNSLYLRVVLDSQKPMGFWEILTTLPFLLLAVSTLSPTLPRSDAIPIVNSMELFFDNASPVLYTLALLGLGIMTLRHYFYLGGFCLVTAFVIYGLRSATLQARYIRSQRALREARDRLEALSLQDALTNVANRRCFDQTLEMEWSRSTRARTPLSLLMLDLDYFKRINDLYGHPYGDSVLAEVAATLRDTLPRSGDLLARYGGEEFAAILTASDREGAVIVAERMLEAIRGLALPQGTITISVGVSTYEPPNFGSKEDLIASADHALYRAKDNGRDRMEYAPMELGRLPGTVEQAAS